MHLHYPSVPIVELLHVASDQHAAKPVAGRLLGGNSRDGTPRSQSDVRASGHVPHVRAKKLLNYFMLMVQYYDYPINWLVVFANASN